MTGRDRTQEILDIKKRDAHWVWYGSYGLKGLQQDWFNNRSSEACTPDFYVIRSVTLLEVFTRRNLADLIDYNRRFTDRAVDLSKVIKIDFSLIRDIQGRTITLGDVIAHSVPVNSFGQIVGYFETLLGKALRPLLEVIVDRWDSEVMKKPSTPIVDDFDAMARTLTRLFDVRHILCHEAPRSETYDLTEIDEFLKRAIQLTNGLHEIIIFEKFGLVPLTQTDMNIAAGKSLKAAEEKMNALLSEIETRVRAADAVFSERKDETKDSTWLFSFKQAQEKWMSYRNAQCDFYTYSSREGTIHPLLWASEADRQTQLRINNLEAWLTEDSEK